MWKALAVLAASVAAVPAAQALELRACVIEFAPWGFYRPQKNGVTEEVGAIYDMLAEFEHRGPYHVTRMLLPYVRVEVELERGGCDFAIMAWSNARASYAIKGSVLVPLEFGVIALKGKPLRSYEDLKDLSIGVARGLKVDARFDADTSLHKSYDRDNITGVKKAVMGRTTAVAGSLSTIRWLMTELNVQERFGDTLVLTSNDLAVAFSRRAAQLEAASEVNQVFNRMVADGTIGKIHSKWFGHQPGVSIIGP